MGVIDEVKPSEPNQDKTLPPNPSVSIPKDESGEVSMPQMLITSVEEVNEEIALAATEQNREDENPVSPTVTVVDAKPVLSTIKEENEEKEEKKDPSLSAQQRPLVISPLSELSRKIIDESTQLRTDSPPLSAVQRPLMFEQVQPNVQETSQEPIHECTSGTVPTAVQRPLVFNGSSVPFEASEWRTLGPLETEIDVDVTQQNGTTALTESGVPVLSISGIDERQYSSKDDATPSDDHEADIHSAAVTNPDSPSKFKGFFTKEDGTSIFSLPKFNIGTSKENSEPQKVHKDDSQTQALPGDISPLHSEKAKDQSKEDTKSPFSLSKFSFGSLKEHMSKEHKDSSQTSSPDVHPDSPVAISDVDGKEHIKESKVTFSLPKFSFGSPKEKEMTAVQHDLSSSPTAITESSPSSASGTDKCSPEATKEGSKHGFSLPKFSFGTSKDNKETPKEFQDSSQTQSASSENYSSSQEVGSTGDPSTEVIKEKSKHGFSFAKFNLGHPKEHKDTGKQPKDHSACVSVTPESCPVSIEITEPDAVLKDTKEEGKHTFQFPKFNFGGPKEQKGTSKEQKISSPVLTDENETDIPKVMGPNQDSKKGTEEAGKPIFSLPKFSFGVSKEHKEDSKDSLSHKQPTSSENRPVSFAVSTVDVKEKSATKEDSKGTFSFPKFGMSGSKGHKDLTKDDDIQVPVVKVIDSAEDSKVDVEAKNIPKESGKHSFSFPKFSFGSSKEDVLSKEPKDLLQSHTSTAENLPSSPEVAKSDTEAKPSTEDSKHVFSFPKFHLSSTKEPKEISKLPKDAITAETLPDAKPSVEDGKHMFSFPKFHLSSTKEPKEVAKLPKDNTQNETIAAESYPVSAESVNTPVSAKDSSKGDSKTFSFPKIGFGSFREHKEQAKKQKDESHPEVPDIQASSTADSSSVEKPKSLLGSGKLLETKEVKKGAPLAPEENDPFNKTKDKKEAPERASSFKMSKKESKETEKESKTGENPSSLYETCCMRLAGMICNKAMEIVSERTSKHGPPKKPPKPSAEAIAKARAAIVAKRVQEYEKRRNFGDDIPLGYNGIRFVDDDTESSTDYKDVDNTAYIIDTNYSIIQEMKRENILDSFSCQSISSYYTADEMTLKDGNFSDNTLESVSLGSQDSLVYKPALSTFSEETNTSPQTDVTVRLKPLKPDIAKKPVEKQKSAPSSFFFFGRSKDKVSSAKVATPVKRVPPPIPPKPRNWPRSESHTQLSTSASSKPEVQKCVDSLSLSPRPVTRTHSASSGIRKRPLTIAGIKETEFPSYMRNIYAEEKPQKPVLTTVVKNQSLQKVPVISASTSALDKSALPKSGPSDIQATSLASLTKKSVPQRPPPPANYTKPTGVMHVETARATDLSSTVNELKDKKPVCRPRPHISPPRPPPPKIKTAASPPPRPPPPSSVITNKVSYDTSKETDAPCIDTIQLPEGPPKESSQEWHEGIKEESYLADQADKSETSDASQLPPLPTALSQSVSDQFSKEPATEITLNATQDQTHEKPSDVVNVDICDGSVSIDTSSNKESDEKIAHDKLPLSSNDNLNLISESPETQMDNCPPTPAVRVLKKPRPPPRTRRLRSRTVEIVSVVWKPEERRRRSNSLSEVDVRKRADSRDALNVDEKPELKVLYTSVQKDPVKSKTEQLNVDFENDRKSPSPEKISSRPLPPPPPPPRSKHHAEHHKSRPGILDPDRSASQGTPEIRSEHELEKEAEMSDIIIKPPVRKKKEEKLRSRSLEDKDKSPKKSPTRCEKTSVSVDRAHSFTSGIPKKPKRKPKVTYHEFHFDENANIAESVAKSHSFSKLPRSIAGPSELGTSNGNRHSIRERSNSEKLAKQHSPVSDISSKKAHSSWYDESDVSGDLGDVDTLPGSLKTSQEKLNYEFKNSDLESSNPNKNKQLRVKKDSVKKPRETSKFYVDINTNETEAPCSPQNDESEILYNTVDKETSPLPLECSEKSVQTSLETLSQGMISRGEQSDDTDELLNLAQTLQDELKVILNRNKNQGPEAESDCDTSGSQNQLDVHDDTFEKAGPSVKRRERKPQSSRAAASSDLWQNSSSDESDESTEDQVKASATLLERKKKKIFYIAQEIMSSEEAFVDALKLLNIDFRNAVDEANKQRGSPVVPCEVVNQILNHLPQLQHLNENLLSELKDRIENWDNLGKIADVIVKMGPFLKLYSWYIQDFESMVALLDDAKKKYPLFAQVIKEFENTPRCSRLALNHYMLKPVQRIPQYRLLLQEYLHHLPKDSPDHNDTLTALQIVSEVANHANESMKQGDNFQKLISIQNSIFGHKEIIKPGRVFVREGELMKLSRKGMQPRWFVLLSDVLLYLTPVQQGLFRVNHELTLTGMKVAIPIQQDYQNEFSIISVTRSFTLAAKSPEERQEWIIALTKAIEENASKRSTFTNVRLQQKVVCSVCSSNRTALHYLGNRNARVCEECYHKLEGSGGYTESGETDSDNQQIAVKAHLRTDSKHGRKPKRQLPSVLKEVCANDQGSSISGYLLKRSGKSWKRDWFVVKDKVMYEYRASEDVAALRSLPLLGYQIETFTEPFEGIESSLLFQLTHPGQPPVVFHADNAGSAERWILALKEATVLE